MTTPTPPDQVTLDPKAFPNEPWARQLVDAFNKLSLQTRQALAAVVPVVRSLSFTTGAAVADSFPLDFPVTAIVSDMRVAQVVRGATPNSVAMVPQWTMLARGQNSQSGLSVRVLSISGLLPNTSYEIRLALS